MTEQPPETNETSVEHPQVQEFFSEETTPKLHALSKLKFMQPDKFDAMKENPVIADHKAELNDAVEKMDTAVRFKIPTTEGIDDLGAAHAAVEAVVDSLRCARGDAKVKMEEAAESLGGHTSQLFMDTYNTFSQAFMYADLLDELVGNN